MSEYRAEMRNVMRAYAAFQMAAVLYIVNNSDQPTQWVTCVILVLFAISIPSTIAYAGLARITSEDEKRNPNPISVISSLLTFGPSLLAISLIISAASKLAAITFLISAVVWTVAIVKLRNRQQNVS